MLKQFHSYKYILFCVFYILFNFGCTEDIKSDKLSSLTSNTNLVQNSAYDHDYASCIKETVGLANNSNTQHVKWYRDSAEMAALYYQAYDLGFNYIKHTVHKKHLKPYTWGIIIDIDETLLDNSDYYKACSQLHDLVSQDNFYKFVIKPKRSEALPGAVDFTCKIKKMQGYVSLVTNRSGDYVDELQDTILNLKKANICFDQVIVAKNNHFDKNARFQAVISGKYDLNIMQISNKLKAHQVIAYFGDNIQDFPNFKQQIANSQKYNADFYKKFGNGYFIFPNPIYGSWTDNKYQ